MNVVDLGIKFDHGAANGWVACGLIPDDQERAEMVQRTIAQLQDFDSFSECIQFMMDNIHDDEVFTTLCYLLKLGGEEMTRRIQEAMEDEELLNTVDPGEMN